MTLIEMMITVGVFSILMLGLLTFYLTCTQLSSGGMNQLNVQRIARGGVDKITDELRIGSTATIFYNFGANPVASTNGLGAYFRVTAPSNSVAGQIYRHFYVSNTPSAGAGSFSRGVWFYSGATTNEGPTASQGEPTLIVDGLTNTNDVFQQVGGSFVINVRVVDPNDRDGKQVIYIRTNVAFRNAGLW
jgi:hypothetical protein